MRHSITVLHFFVTDAENAGMGEIQQIDTKLRNLGVRNDQIACIYGSIQLENATRTKSSESSSK
jgi:hypothetical protein